MPALRQGSLRRRDAAIKAAGESFAERNAALRGARAELDARARDLAAEEEAHRQVAPRARRQAAKALRTLPVCADT